MDYDPENFPRIAGMSCEDGATDARLAQIFDTPVEVIRKWKEEDPAFAGACAKGRRLAHSRIRNILMKAATGSKVKRTEIVYADGVPKQISVQEERPPDVYAAAVLLSQSEQAGAQADYETIRIKVLKDLGQRLERTTLRPREE
jgi:hypothetical protein